MRALPLLLAAVSASAFAQPQAAPPQGKVLTLGEALKTARERQPQLRQAQASTQAARARADQALSSLLPQLNGTASYGRDILNGGAARLNAGGPDSFAFGVNARQLIWDFGQTTGRWSAAKASADSQADQERVTRLNVDVNVRTAYFGARAAKALVLVGQETLANQDRHLQQIQGFVEVGTRPEIDLAQARTTRANAQVQLINAQNGYETAKAQLNQAMGVEGPTDYDVADESFPMVAGEDQPLQPLLDEAIRARPELAALANQVRAQELTVGSIEGSYWPSFNLTTGVSDGAGTFNDLGTSWEWTAGVGLSWPLFQGGLTRAEVGEARAQLSNLQAQLDASRQQVRLEVDQARLAVRAAAAGLGAAGEAVTNAREQLKLAEGRYQTGVGSSLELNDAQLALANAEAQQVSAEYNLASARARLVKALGRP